MGYWIYLDDNTTQNPIVTDESRAEGGNYCLGGTNEAALNVTYNYSIFFNFRLLDGMSAEAGAKLLKAIIAKLKDDVDDNYWNPTEGNVKRCLQTLLDFATYAINNNIKAHFTVH